MKTITKSEDIPDEPHLAVIVNDQYYSPGYDAGDPSYPSPYTRYIVMTEKELADWIEYEEKLKKKDYRVIRVQPMKVEAKVAVTLS